MWKTSIRSRRCCVTLQTACLRLIYLYRLHMGSYTFLFPVKCKEELFLFLHKVKSQISFSPLLPVSMERRITVYMQPTRSLHLLLSYINKQFLWSGRIPVQLSLKITSLWAQGQWSLHRAFTVLQRAKWIQNESLINIRSGFIRAPQSRTFFFALFSDEVTCFRKKNALEGEGQSSKVMQNSGRWSQWFPVLSKQTAVYR